MEKESWENPMMEFERSMGEITERFRKRMGELQPYLGSESLQFALAAGFRPQMAYTVAQTAEYSGVPKATLYEEHREGRIRFKSIGKRNALIPVTEMDRWMNGQDE